MDELCIQRKASSEIGGNRGQETGKYDKVKGEIAEGKWFDTSDKENSMTTGNRGH